MTIVVDADVVKLEQVKAQLGRLVDVIEVTELSEGHFVDRELLLAQVKMNGQTKPALEDLAKRYGGKIAHAADHALVLEVAGDTHTLDRVVEELRPHGITKLVRTGRVALEK
jgi:acetolactate synthase-1/3 small subunit